ncbi:MAG: ribonuclease H-like domain-containing protein [candidate division KSB1 bacterium]|nr:ribonuclease H-like domain-containing protein [candidate division KSB1 bacterium]
MPSIKEKLYKLDTGKQEKARETQQFDPEQLQSIQATLKHTQRGLCISREKRFSLDFTHGPYTLETFLHIPKTVFDLLAKEILSREFNPKSVVFLDTETTGLAGGTGTYAFIIGVGFFEKNEFKIQQFFLPDYDYESAQLYELAELLASKSALITFNGKSYDIPLLKNRFILNKINLEWESYTHIDLLHTSRRLWGRQIGSCSLQNIEQAILKIKRKGDIPGAEIPQLYFDYLIHKDLPTLLDVFKHNVIDLLSLLSISVSASQLFTHPVGGTVNQDFHSALRTFISLNRYKQAHLFIEKLPGQICFQPEILYSRALLYKRMQDWESALECFRLIVKKDRHRFIDAYIEIAKLYEHKFKDYRAALDTLNELEDRIRMIRELRDKNIFDNKAIQYRRDRLYRKIAADDRNTLKSNGIDTDS